MKYLKITILALFATGNANACFTILDGSGQPYGPDDYNFDVVELEPPVELDVTFFIDAYDCSSEDSISVSISGNKGEFCLQQHDAFGECTSSNKATIDHPGGSIQVFFQPSTPGQKKKKLDIDATNDLGNDVSRTIRLLGSTPPLIKSIQ